MPICTFSTKYMRPHIWDEAHLGHFLSKEDQPTPDPKDPKGRVEVLLSRVWPQAGPLRIMVIPDRWTSQRLWRFVSTSENLSRGPATEGKAWSLIVDNPPLFILSLESNGKQHQLTFRYIYHMISYGWTTWTAVPPRGPDTLGRAASVLNAIGMVPPALPSGVINRYLKAQLRHNPDYGKLHPVQLQRIIEKGVKFGKSGL